MAKTTIVANALLDVLFSGAPSGTAPIGDLTITYPLFCKFLSAPSSPDVAGPEWQGVGGYITGGVSLANSFDNPAANSSKANTAAVIVTNSPGGLWSGNEIVDSSIPSQRLEFGPSTPLNKTVNPGDTCIIPIGSLVGRES
jgi:hypothetical protein